MVYQPRKEYSWSGYTYSVDANVVGEIMEEIEKKNGSVTRDALLDASRDISSPTHELFEWNDSKAAEQYRLTQAGNIIRCLKVRVIETEQIETPVYSAYVNVSDPDRQGQAVYYNINKAMEDEETRDVVLKRALRELEVYHNKYKNLEELHGIFVEYKKVKELHN